MIQEGGVFLLPASILASPPGLHVLLRMATSVDGHSSRQPSLSIWQLAQVLAHCPALCPHRRGGVAFRGAGLRGPCFLVVLNIFPRLCKERLNYPTEFSISFLLGYMKTNGKTPLLLL